MIAAREVPESNSRYSKFNGEFSRFLDILASVIQRSSLVQTLTLPMPQACDLSLLATKWWSTQTTRISSVQKWTSR